MPPPGGILHLRRLLATAPRAKLSRIRSRDVALQLLNGLRLAGDHPLHQVANGDDSHYGVVLQDRQMAEVAFIIVKGNLTVTNCNRQGVTKTIT